MCTTKMTRIIVVADRFRSCLLDLLLTLFLSRAGGKQGPLFPFHSQKHRGAELFCMFSGGDEGRHSSMKRDSKPAGWAEAGLLISGYWGKRGNVLSRESPTPPRLQLNPGLLATSASLPGGRGRTGRSREGRGYNALPYPAPAPMRFQASLWLVRPSNHISVPVGPPSEPERSRAPSELLLVVADVRLPLSLPQYGSGGVVGGSYS